MRRAIITALTLAALAGQAHATGVVPTPAEQQDLNAIKGRMQGRVVWESNRTGAWELYTMNADGAGVRQLSHLAQANDPRAFNGYLRPRFSPDGQTVLFAYGQRGASPESWIIPSDGGEAQRLAVGSPLNWSADGRSVYMVRDGALLSYDVASSQEERVHPATLPADGHEGGMVGTLRADGSSVVLCTPKSNELFVLDQGETVKTMGGCEPRFSPDGRYLYWVQGPKDFRVMSMDTGEEKVLLGLPPVEPYNYTYFPTVSDDGHWLLYGASPGQHSHETSDYEVFIVELSDYEATGTPIRLTFNDRTDRWPDLHVGLTALADGPYDALEPGGPIWIASFPTEHSGADTGGLYGLWPQNEECKGTMSFVDGDDAADGDGGSLLVDYEIGGEPNSVALWITPLAGSLDLSEHKRLEIWAKGSVPTFTIVAEDLTAGGDGGASGVGDYVVEGVTTEWTRFNIPLDAFKPRQRGGQVDWRRIKTLAIAFISPTSPKSGSLQIDNLRAL